MVVTTGGAFGSTKADNLVAGTYPPLNATVFDLKESGIIERGTVLSRESNGKYAVLGTGTGTAAAIVAETTDETDTIVTAYIGGLFYRNLLVVGDGYELTEADEHNLRLAGILLKDGI